MIDGLLNISMIRPSPKSPSPPLADREGTSRGGLLNKIGSCKIINN